MKDLSVLEFSDLTYEKLESLKLKMSGKVKKMCRPPEMIDMPKFIEKSEGMTLKYDKIIVNKHIPSTIFFIVSP